jgi:uncharacterized protein YjbI with pentapeptide repeats
LTFADLTNANLTDANLPAADLSYAILFRANVTNTSPDSALYWIGNADLTGATGCSTVTPSGILYGYC